MIEGFLDHCCLVNTFKGNVSEPAGLVPPDPAVAGLIFPLALLLGTSKYFSPAYRQAGIAAMANRIKLTETAGSSTQNKIFSCVDKNRRLTGVLVAA